MIIFVSFTQQIKKLVKFFLPNSIYHKIKNLKYRNYDLASDLLYNENLLKLFQFDNKKIKFELNLLNFEYYSTSLSWHYHLFLGFKQYFKNKKINILEIGTFDGSFANFISKVFSESYISTIDLNESDNQFINTYNRKEKKILDKFLNLRNYNLNRQNIKFNRLNSTYIKTYFKKKFDLIWVDGDHLDPQVSLDIINSLDLLNDDGILCVDDIIMNKNFPKTKYVSNEGYFTLKSLEEKDLIKNYFLIKRIRLKNLTDKKYVSISIKKNNSKFIYNNKVSKNI